MKNPITGVINEFNQVRKEAVILADMPEITMKQIEAKQAVREEQRRRRWGTEADDYVRTPIAKHGIVTHIRADQDGQYINFYIDSDEISIRLKGEAAKYGGFVVFDNHGVYVLHVRPNFDYFEVAKYLGRGGGLLVRTSMSPMRTVPLDDYVEANKS